MRRANLRRRTNTKVVSINEIVGSNLERLRRTSRDKIISREQLIADMREYGIQLAGPANTPDKVARVEKGVRPLRADELYALALYFDVPLWAFFIPPADLLSVEIQAGEDVRSAIDIAADMLYPEAAWGVEWDLQTKLHSIAMEAAVEHDDPDAARTLRDAITRPR